MTTEVIPHDQIFGRRLGNLIDVGIGFASADRPVQRRRGNHVRKAEPGDEGRCFSVSVPVGNVEPQTPFLRGFVVAMHYAARCTRLVDEPALSRIKINLVAELGFAQLRDGCTALPNR